MAGNTENRIHPNRLPCSVKVQQKHASALCGVSIMYIRIGYDGINKLFASRQRSNFGNFQQCFHHNFRLKWKFLLLMVSSERSSSDLLEYTLLQIGKYFFIYKNQFLSE